MTAEYVFVEEGWWHPNCKSGQVHPHPENPNGGWSVANHRSCEPVYTRRPADGVARTIALDELYDRVVAFGVQAFGETTDKSAPAVARKIAEEAGELADDPGSLEEAADVQIGLLMWSYRSGFGPGQLINAADEKMAVNESRRWTTGPDGRGHHVPADNTDSVKLDTGDPEPAERGSDQDKAQWRCRFSDQLTMIGHHGTVADLEAAVRKEIRLYQLDIDPDAVDYAALSRFIIAERL